MLKYIKTLAALVAAALVTAAVGLGALRGVERSAQDALFQRRGVPTGEIVLIGIDEETLAELGPYGPSYRGAMAYALQALAADPENLPAVVAIDVLYEGYSGSQADERLAQAAEKLGCVVTASMAVYGEEIALENGRPVSRNAAAVVDYILPYEELRSVTTQGHINAMIDTDGILRHALLTVDAGGEPALSMAAQTAQRYLARQGRTLKLPPVNAGGHFYVPFTGRPGDYADGASLYRLISGGIPSGFWKDKIVLIGPYASSLQDSYFTSISKGEAMYGVEYQANVIQSLLEENHKREAPDSVQLALLFAVCAAAAVCFMRMKVVRGTAVCAGVIVVSLAATLLLYQFGWVCHVLWIPAAALALYLMSLAAHYVQASRERHALALEKERRDTELALATRIQANALPKVFPPFPDRHEFDVFASMTPAKEVGGDLYDFFLMDDDHLCLVIGDVSGKGVPASLFMMLSLTLIHHVAMREQSPAKILQTVNEEICSRNPEEMFVTVWLGVLEISTGRLTAANAGHEYPAVKDASGHFELLKDRHGFVVGGMAGVRYREYELQLAPGSKLFVYTDGVAEATDGSEQMFGTDRMIAALRGREDSPPEAIAGAVSAAVQDFVGAASQFDDLTMLCLEYRGNGTVYGGEV